MRLLLLWLMLLGAEPMTLTVELRTVTDQPVAGVRVTVRDAMGLRVLAEGITDSYGQVQLAVMPQAVRVVVVGTLLNRVALRPTRQDREGIRVQLPSRAWRMALRVDTDGLVFPDLSLEGAGAPDDAAALAVAPTRVQPSATGAAPTIGAPPTSANGVPDAVPAATESRWAEVVGLLGLGVLVAVLGVVLVAQRR